MGQQLRKIAKRRRLKAYIERKKALAKQGIARKISRPSKVAAEAEEKPAAKKAVKKKVTKKVAAAKAPEAEAPEVEETVVDTPATEGTEAEAAAE
jgi:hypothetical protein